MFYFLARAGYLSYRNLDARAVSRLARVFRTHSNAKFFENQPLHTTDDRFTLIFFFVSDRLDRSVAVFPIVTCVRSFVRRSHPRKVAATLGKQRVISQIVCRGLLFPSDASPTYELFISQLQLKHSCDRTPFPMAVFFFFFLFLLRLARTLAHTGANSRNVHGFNAGGMVPCLG